MPARRNFRDHRIKQIQQSGAESFREQVQKLTDGEVLKLADFIARRGKPCGVCLRPTDGFGMFQPNEAFAVRIGKPHGCVIYYPVCSECVDKPETTARIEQEIIREFGVH